MRFGLTLPLRIGPIVVTTKGWADELDRSIGPVRVHGGKVLADNERNEAIIRRQRDLVCEAEAQRDRAVARQREVNELLLEQQIEIDRLTTMLRHPVNQPPMEES